jgi:dGTPase
MIKALNKYVYEKAVKKDKVDVLKEFSTETDNPKSFSIEKFLGFNRKWDDGTEKDKRRLILDFRVKMIDYLAELAICNFERNLEDIDKGEYSSELLKDDEFQIFEALSDFSQHKIISRRDIQELELTGNSVINGLLDILMSYAFSEDKKYRRKIKAVISKSRMEATLHENMNEKVKYMKFDEEDLWNFDIEQLDNYSKLRLIVDFVASMTDKYSVELYQKFAGMRL